MRTFGKAAAVVALAAAMLVAGALVIVRTTDAAGPPLATRDTSSSALLLPAAGAGSLDAAIASLQRRLREIPDDWRGFCCIESANVRDHRLKLSPGDRHALSLRITCGDGPA